MLGPRRRCRGGVRTPLEEGTGGSLRNAGSSRMFPRRTDSARLLRTLHCSCVGILYSCCASVAGHSAGDGAKITSGGCSWAEDASLVQYQYMGKPGKDATGPADTSPEECAAWCCKATHMRQVPSTTGVAWQFTEQIDDTPPPPGDPPRACDVWQYNSDPAQKDTWQGGCWVAPATFKMGDPKWKNKPLWIGANGCVRSEFGWGPTVLLVLLMGGLVYVGGGVAYGKRSGRGGSSSGGPFAAHPHAQRWHMLAALVMDGLAYAKAGRQAGGEGRRNERRREPPESLLGSSKAKRSKAAKSSSRAADGQADSTRAKKSKKGGAEPSLVGQKIPQSNARLARSSDKDVTAADSAAANVATRLQEKAEAAPGVHSSQAKIKVTALTVGGHDNDVGIRI